MGTKPWGQGSLTVRMNDGRVVTRPYREAISLVSRRLAEQVSAEDEVVELETVPLDAPEPDPLEAATNSDEPHDIPGPNPMQSTEEQRAAYDNLLLEDLRELTRQRGLPVSGNKPDLIERLVADDDDMDLVGLSAEAPASGASAEDEPHEGSATEDGEN